MPILRYEIESSMTQEQLIEKLNSVVSKSFVSIYPKDMPPFLGKVSENGFRISRTTIGRNSFKPVIYGRFLDGIQGPSVRVIMTFHPLVWILFIVWAIFFGTQMLEQITISNIGGIRILDIVILFAPIIIGAPVFFIEAAKSKKLLNQVLELNDD